MIINWLYIGLGVGVVAIVGASYTKDRKLANMLRVGGAACVVVPLLLLIGCHVFISGMTRTETSPQKYSALINEWTPTGLVAHFPNPLPATASNIKLSAFPGFLQGGAWFQVRLTLPAAEVSKIYDDATKIAKDFYDGGGVFKSTNSKEGGLPGTSFHTSDNQHQSDFPDDYRIFVFAAQRPGGNTWESGKCYGVVISKQRNEVIYYAENW